MSKQSKSGSKRKRKKPSADPKPKPRGYNHLDPVKDNGWFELIEYFDATRSQRMSLKDDKKTRVFILGAVNETAVVQCSSSISEGAVEAVRATLASTGIKAVIVDENVKWCRFRRCSPKEEKLLDEATPDGHSVAIPWKEEAQAEEGESGETESEPGPGV